MGTLPILLAWEAQFPFTALLARQRPIKFVEQTMNNEQICEVKQRDSSVLVDLG